MKRQKQLYIPQLEDLSVKVFGGSLLKGNPTNARPLSFKRPIHLVLKSSISKGRHSLLHPKRMKHIRTITHYHARKNRVRVYRYANVGNHLHIVILVKSRRGYSCFIRSITGLIARLSLGAEKSRPKGKGFWDSRPFTRIVEWGREYRGVIAYVEQNILEVAGVAPYRKLLHPKYKLKESHDC